MARLKFMKTAMMSLRFQTSSTTASYSFTTTLLPNDHLAVSFGYNYWNVYNQADICFNYSITYTNPPPGTGTLPVSTSPPGVATAPCTITGASVGAAGLETLSTYASTDHFAHAEVTWKPCKRITAAVGYGGSFVRGSSTALNPLMPSGTLSYNYQLPFGSINFEYHKGLSYKMAWKGIITGLIRRGTPTRSGWPLYLRKTSMGVMRRFRFGMRSKTQAYPRNA